MLGLNTVFGLSKFFSESIVFLYASACQILYIEKDENDKIISDSIMPTKVKNSKFIKSLEFLKSWNDSNKLKLSEKF